MCDRERSHLIDLALTGASTARTARQHTTLAKQFSSGPFHSVPSRSVQPSALRSSPVQLSSVESRSANTSTEANTSTSPSLSVPHKSRPTPSCPGPSRAIRSSTVQSNPVQSSIDSHSIHTVRHSTHSREHVNDPNFKRCRQATTPNCCPLHRPLNTCMQAPRRSHTHIKRTARGLGFGCDTQRGIAKGGSPRLRCVRSYDDSLNTAIRN